MPTGPKGLAQSTRNVRVDETRPLHRCYRNIGSISSVRRHGFSDDDMIHAFRNHWRSFESNDVSVTVSVGLSRTGAPLEIGIVSDSAGEAIIHAMPARARFLKDWWIP